MKTRLLTLFALLFIGYSAIAQEIQYGLFWINSDVLEVRAVSSVDISGIDSRIGVCQVTLKADAGAIEITQITPQSLSWHVKAFVESPAEDPGFDYFSFIYTGGGNLSFTANTEVPLFRIKFGIKGLIKSISLTSPSDPFNTIPNSAGNNPGNSFFNYSGDLYTGNYHNPDATTGLGDDNAERITLKVVPNPVSAAEGFMIESGLEPGTIVRVLVSSATGQVLSDMEYTVEPTLDIPALNTAPGVYLVQLIQPEIVLVGRVVVR